MQHADTIIILLILLPLHLNVVAAGVNENYINGQLIFILQWREIPKQLNSSDKALL